MTPGMSERAQLLQQHDFDPSYIPAYKQSSGVKDPAKPFRKKIKKFIGSQQILLTLGMMAGDKFAYKVFDQVRSHRTSNSGIMPEDAAVRITRIYNHYLLFGGVDRLHGKICEIGPGDTAGVSLIALRYGAECSDLVERFDRTFSVEGQAAIYRALSEIHGLDQFKKSAEWKDDCIQGIRWYKDAAERHLRKKKSEGVRYDTIISNAVLEHLDDPLAVITTGLEVLEKGGVMLHQVGLDDHGLFSSLPENRYDELSWFQTPDWLQRRFAKNTGRPNRILFHEYKHLAEELKRSGKIRDYKFVIRQLAGVGKLPNDPKFEFDHLPRDMRDAAETFVDQRKPKFARSLRDVPSLDLAIKGFFLAIRGC